MYEKHPSKSNDTSPQEVASIEPLSVTDAHWASEENGGDGTVLEQDEDDVVIIDEDTLTPPSVALPPRASVLPDLWVKWVYLIYSMLSDRYCSSTIPPRDIIRQSVKDFFAHIYPLPRYSFLFAPHINRAVSSGEVDPALVLALCGTAALYTPSTDTDRKAGQHWLALSEGIIRNDLDHQSIAKLQALLLIIHHALHSGSFTKAFMLIAHAARAAFGLRLNYEHSYMPFEEQEIRRRTSKQILKFPLPLLV